MQWSHLFNVRRWFTGLTLVAAIGSATLLPVQAAHAQSRALPDFTDLVDQVGPSVVNIRTAEKVSTDSQASSGIDPNMLEFFRRFGIPVPNAPKQQTPRRNQQPDSDEVQPTGVGSGFILTSDGVIMTNAHVVKGADEVLVTLTDKREFKARILGADERSDVAVVKIDAAGLPALKVGDVSRLRVGEWVMAIGSPFGLENTVTAGIVSAKQRDTGDYLPLIQTDVAINPGNSGGPLINMRGEVVGINSQIYSRSGGFMGISFSIPIDEAMRVADQLRANGKVTRGRIGVQIDQVSKEVADSIGLGKPMGALVQVVEDGSPAQKAGVEAGDIITKFDGKQVEKASDLPRMVGGTAPGSQHSITVFRRGKSMDLQVTVVELSTDKTANAPAAVEKAKPSSSLVKTWGLTVAELTDAQKKELKTSGVRLTAITDAAARSGLQVGDVLVQVANTPVASVKELDDVLSKQDKNKAVSVLFRRGDWSQFTVIRPLTK